MTHEVTQADREAAHKVLGGTAPYGLLEGKRDDLSLVQAFAAHRIAATQEAERRIVEWLRAEARLCDCFAREADECACGAWDDYKTVPVERLADAIENGEHRND